MPIPNRPDKYADSPILRASAMLASRRGNLSDLTLHSALLCYQIAPLRWGVKRYRGRRLDGLLGEHYLLRAAPGDIVLSGNFGIGAPVVGVLLEEFAALGVRRCIAIGLAAALQPDLAPGAIVIADRAIRDEGTSHHYLPPARYAEATPALAARLASALDAKRLPYRMGPTWTTDAPYRETVGEVRQYRGEGILTVEMEAAALFAVGQCLDMEVASAFAISDSLASESWRMNPDPRPADKSLIHLVAAAMEALRP